MTRYKQFGLARRERIVDDKEFERVYKNGNVIKRGCLIIRALPNNRAYARLGVAVSKKIFRHAVTRNRIKRMIREAFRLNKNQLPKGVDFIIGVRVKDPKLITLPAVQAGLSDSFISYPQSK
jgi:ribonuclease P protein component